MFILEPMDIIPEERLKHCSRDKEGNFNPFTIDSFSMGKKLSKNIYTMFDFHDDNPFRNMYFVNTISAERQKLVFKKSISGTVEEDVVKKENAMFKALDEMKRIKLMTNEDVRLAGIAISMYQKEMDK